MNQHHELMIIIHIIYGAAFFVLGILAFCHYRRDGNSLLVDNLAWLSLFGIIHGVHEWLQMLLYAGVFYEQIDSVTELSNGLLISSFAILFGFALRINRPQIRLNWLQYLLLLLLVSACFLFVWQQYHVVIASARWLICFPAALCIGIALWREQRFSSVVSQLYLNRHYRNMALGFWGYAILSGLIVKKTEGMPDFIPSQEVFYDDIGIPVQLFRAVCALGITISLVFILRRFNNYAYDQAQANAQTLEELVLTRTQELENEIKQRQALQERLMLFKYLFDFAHEAFLITDASEHILEVNPWFTHLTGYSANEVIGKRPALLKSGKHDAAFFQDMWQSIIETGIWQGEVFDKRKNGDIYPKWLSIVAVPDEQGKVRHYVGLFSDITDRKEKEAEHYRLATTDPLTGLVNRRAMEDCLTQIMSGAHTTPRSLTMMLIDLDYFKKVNDTLGHLVGDKLLCTIAQRLKDQVRTSDLVVRLGGDEFVVALLDINTQEIAQLVGEKIVAALAEVALIDGHSLQISASIGIAFYPHDATTPLKLLHKADVAAYHAKGLGRNTYCFYHSSMEKSDR